MDKYDGYWGQFIASKIAFVIGLIVTIWLFKNHSSLCDCAMNPLCAFLCSIPTIITLPFLVWN